MTIEHSEEECTMQAEAAQTTTNDGHEGLPWWVLLLEGIATLLIGILLIVAPGMSLAALVQVLGIFWLVGGLFAIIRIFIEPSRGYWFWLLLQGILGIAAGIAVLNHPLYSTILVPTLLVIILGIQGIVFGAIGLFKSVSGGFAFGALVWSVVNILFGIVLVANPLLSAVALPSVLGLFGIVGGLMVIISAFRIR
jgi:uncharacterized membrane protein HdeD (DUF308 family)